MAVSSISAIPASAVIRVGVEGEVAGLDRDGLGGRALGLDVGGVAAAVAAATAGGDARGREQDQRHSGDGAAKRHHSATVRLATIPWASCPVTLQ